VLLSSATQLASAKDFSGAWEGFGLKNWEAPLATDRSVGDS